MIEPIPAQKADWENFIVVVDASTYQPSLCFIVAIVNAVLPPAFGIICSYRISQTITHDKFMILN